MLSSGAHVSINGVEYLLDTTESPYTYDFVPLLQEQPEIAGSPGKKNASTDKLMWVFDDWSGGEGNRIYYPDQPTKYHWSEKLSPRIKGQLCGPPTVSSQNITAIDLRKRPLWCIASGALWFASSSDGVTDATVTFSTDGVDFGGNDEAVGFTTLGNTVTALAGDHEYLYVAGARTSAGTRQIRRMKRDLSTGVVTGEAVVAEGTAVLYAGMALYKDKLYLWTGKRLYAADLGATFPLAAADRPLVDNVGVTMLAQSSFGTKWWADIVATEDSLVYFSSVEKGYSRAWEYKEGIPTSFWTPPPDTTIRCVTYTAGVVYFGCQNGVGRGSLWAVPLKERVPYRVADLRTGYMDDTANYTPIAIAPSVESTVLITTDNGHIFQYDPVEGSLTSLGDITLSGTFQIGDIIQFGDYRLAISYDPSDADGAGSHGITYWKDDTTSNITTNPPAGSAMYMGEWDFGYPWDRKIFMGFHIAFKPMVANQSIILKYSTDSGTSWTTAATVTYGTGGNALGRIYVPVSTSGGSVGFTRLRIRVDLTGTGGTTPYPTLYAIAAEAKLLTRSRSWDLVLRIKNEEGMTRPSYGGRQAVELRDNIRDAADAKNVVTFLDGFPYGPEIAYDTYYVTIEGIKESVGINGEGTMLVRLVETST